jgi:hypothetical protein
MRMHALLCSRPPLPRTLGGDDRRSMHADLQRLHPARDEKLNRQSFCLLACAHIRGCAAQARRARWKRRAHARIDRPAGRLAGQLAAPATTCRLSLSRARAPHRRRVTARAGPPTGRPATERMHVPCFSTARTSPSSAHIDRAAMPPSPCKHAGDGAR